MEQTATEEEPTSTAFQNARSRLKMRMLKFWIEALHRPVELKMFEK
jgi:hypothetical protein